ncbi:MAG: hypothetical protein V1775_00365 [Bacteroidota bacterium]
MKIVRFKLIDPVHPELRSLGLRSEMEFAGELHANGAIHFRWFYVIINQCTVWPDGYQILVDHNIVKVTGALLSDAVPVYGVEELFNPDTPEEILVIRVADLSFAQRTYLNI